MIRLPFTISDKPDPTVALVYSSQQQACLDLVMVYSSLRGSMLIPGGPMRLTCNARLAVIWVVGICPGTVNGRLGPILAECALPDKGRDASGSTYWFQTCMLADLILPPLASSGSFIKHLPWANAGLRWVRRLPGLMSPMS